VKRPVSILPLVTIGKYSCLFSQWFFFLIKNISCSLYLRRQTCEERGPAPGRGRQRNQPETTKVIYQVPTEGSPSAFSRTLYRLFRNMSYLCCPTEFQAVLQFEFIILWCYHGPGNSQNPLLSTLCTGGLSQASHKAGGRGTSMVKMCPGNECTTYGQSKQSCFAKPGV
jgi:hypothetical protein